MSETLIEREMIERLIRLAERTNETPDTLLARMMDQLEQDLNEMERLAEEFALNVPDEKPLKHHEDRCTVYRLKFSGGKPVAHED